MSTCPWRQWSTWAPPWHQQASANTKPGSFGENARLLSRTHLQIHRREVVDTDLQLLGVHPLQAPRGHGGIKEEVVVAIGEQDCSLPCHVRRVQQGLGGAPWHPGPGRLQVVISCSEQQWTAGMWPAAGNKVHTDPGKGPRAVGSCTRMWTNSTTLWDSLRI